MKFYVVIFAFIAALMVLQVHADDDKPQRHNLFQHVNQWFSRLRNRGHNHNNNNDKDKNEEKKEEPTTKAPTPPMMPGFPAAAFPMGAPGAFMTPFGPAAAPAGMMPGMYNPMAMATQQFAHHVPAGAPARPPMMGAPPGAFGPMNPMMGTMGSMGSPYSFSNSPMMPPMHHDFSDMHHGSHHGHHGSEGFSPFAGPYGSSSFAGETPEDPYGASSHHHHHQSGQQNVGPDSMESNQSGPSQHQEYDQYQKKK